MKSIYLFTIESAEIAAAPNGPAAILRTIEEILASPCLQKDGNPEWRIFLYISADGLKFEIFTLMTDFLTFVNVSNIQKLINWLIIVASAAPETPMLKL